MFVIESRNPHGALPAAIHSLLANGVQEDSRNGPVIRMRTPVTTIYTNPLERLTFHDWREDNPFFLLIEPLWMLAGRDDLKQLTPFVKRMAEYSDDGGKTSPGAYGKRWRDWASPIGSSTSYHWPDQLNWAVRRLRDDPADRRVVIQMWDPMVDIVRADARGKDVPCNLTILPWIEGGRLHLTVFNRSNDIIWGLYSANAAQFSTLLEYLARRIGTLPGTLTTVSNNFHAYMETLPEGPIASWPDPYAAGHVNCTHLISLSEETLQGEKAEQIFREDLAMLFEYGTGEMQLKARFSFFRQVVAPMIMAHRHWKLGTGIERYDGAIEILDQMPEGSDWKRAAISWISRRRANYLREKKG